MTTALTKSVTNAVYRIVFYQLLLILGPVLIIFAVKDTQSGFSALTGGLAYWLPTFIFTRSVAACASARRVGRFMMAFFGGEVVKLICSGALFMLAVTSLHVQVLYAVVGLALGIVAFWVASVACLYRSEVPL